MGERLEAGLTAARFLLDANHLGHQLTGNQTWDPQRHVIWARLHSSYQPAAAIDAPEANRLAVTIEAWWPAIEAAITTGYSNARSEGYNRMAKHQGPRSCLPRIP